MKKRVVSILMAMVLSFSLSACGNESTQKNAETEKSDQTQEAEENSETDDGSIQRGGILKIGTTNQVMNLGYPGLGNGDLVGMPAIESLCRYTSDGELAPWLCESFELDSDALTLTVILKQGIKFHDGTDFNAEAVKWNWEAFTATGRSEIAAIESIECKDEYTVVAHLSQWDNTIAANALYIAGLMYSPAYAEENGQEAANINPVGTGPFKFKEWQMDVKLVYEANEDYWIEGQPYLDGIEFEFMSDANTLSTAYRSDEIDIVCANNTELMSIMSGIGEETKAHPGIVGDGAVTFVVYGCTDEESPTYDINVRRAIAHAVNWEELCTAVGNMYYTNQWAIPGVWSYNDEVIGYDYDIAKAKELLAEAGYEDGVKINCYTMEGSKTTATMIQQYLSEAGIDLQIQILEQAKSDEMTGIGGNWDGMILSAGRVNPEMASIYERSFTDEGVRYVGGLLHPQDLVDAIRTAKATLSDEEKEENTKLAAKLIIDEYCMMSPIGIGSSGLYEKDYVNDSGLLQIHASLWTPEICWISK